ncbi:40S ribosomal protein S17 [Rhodotorula toruloides ATCC 204091]|uniref:40S ribosomal protein S17 n=1 Tax=Rhodotorula toruloides TaxID=5286 RepID=A0A2T0ADX7_RHOTO|nr:40S ribosomal protein S17 [Rhodotorula toruloides ATCC 204091]PRQ76202.1 40S ribosomal protein S17 [Rhodotorula toruloides]
MESARSGGTEWTGAQRGALEVVKRPDERAWDQRGEGEQLRGKGRVGERRAQEGSPVEERRTQDRADQGRVRTKTVKRASRVVIEKYYPRLTLDFHTNKKICDEVAIIPSKRLRNKIAGFTTHLMKRIQKGPVRGISFKLQEEERERKDNYVPEVSALDSQGEPLEVDPDTKDLLKTLGFDALPVNVVVPQTFNERPGRRNVVGLGRRQD